MDLIYMRSKAAEWMIDRGWKRIIAKRDKTTGFEQSLFDHTITALDMIIVLAPMLKEIFGLTDEDILCIFVSILLHDLGKEKEEFKDYIAGRRKEHVSHIDENMTKEAFIQLKELFNLPDNIEKEVLTAVSFHMKRERTAGNVFYQVALGGHHSDNWKQLSEIVDWIDNMVSIPSLLEAVDYLEKSQFAPLLQITYHQVKVRGLATAYLHKSTIESFKKIGWKPFIHYVNGTIYIKPADESGDLPSRDCIIDEMENFLSPILEKNLAEMIVGNPTASMIPKRDLFDYRKIESYLNIALKRVRADGFFKKKEDKQQEKALQYIKLTGLESGPKGVTEEFLRQQIDRIGRAHQEMVAFKMFKAIFSEKDIDPEELFPLNEDEVKLSEISEKIDNSTDQKREQYEKKYDRELEKARKRALEQIRSKAEECYDNIFSKGAFAQLMKTSTMEPAKDMAYSVDYYWSIQARKLDSSLPDVKVEELEDSIRKSTLIKVLSQLVLEIFDDIHEPNRPLGLELRKVAKVFTNDLIYPIQTIDINMIIEDQLKGYLQSKSIARKTKGEHLCPICNEYFTGGTRAKADFVGKPESHTNRAVCHQNSGSGIVICDTCKYERFIMQILLEKKPGQTIVFFPRSNIGVLSGEELASKAIELWNNITDISSPTSENINERISLSFTNSIYQRFKKSDWQNISTSDLARIFAYTISADKQKEMQRELLRAIEEEIDDDIDSLNDIFGTEYTDVKELVNAALYEGLDDEDGTISKLKKKLFSKETTFRIIVETPHVILLPQQSVIAIGKDSDVNASLRQLFVLCIMALTFQVKVMMLEEGEEIPEDLGCGIVKIPNNPELKKLIKSHRKSKGINNSLFDEEWLSLEETEEWLERIGAAVSLANLAKYPERSNIYQVLTTPDAGHILQRVENKLENTSIPAFIFDMIDIFNKSEKGVFD